MPADRSRLLRCLAGLSGAALLGLGLAFPGAWTEGILRPVEGAAPPSPSGVLLFRCCLVLDGVGLLAFAAVSRGGRRKAPVGSGQPAPPVSRAEAAGAVVVTATALLLRLHHAGSDLWVDEIVNLRVFRELPLLKAVSSFVFANNHMLNTVLVKAMVACFGEREWAVRVPAILFGTATVPALWLAARRALGRGWALLAAFLLATSYHHVFFSQNARGYAAHVFFAVAGTGLLARGLREDRGRTWLAYALAMVGGVASLLHGLFVLGGHAALLAFRWLRGTLKAQPEATLRHGATVLALTAYGSLHLYALVIPDALASITVVYRTPAMGYSPLSRDHLQEWARAGAAAAGPAGLAGAVVLLALAAGGFALAQKRDPVLAWGLTSPLALLSGLVLLGRLNVTPRTFLLALPLGLICLTACLSRAAELLSRLLAPRGWRGTFSGVALAAVAGAGSLAALGPYYRHPKQDFRGAMRFVEGLRRPGDAVLAVYLAKWGYRHYAAQFGLEEGRDFFAVHSDAEIEAVRGRRPEARLFAVVTLRRANRLEYPDLEAAITRRFRLLERFPGTLGDGEVSVWVER